MEQPGYGKFNSTEAPQPEELSGVFCDFDFIELVAQGGLGAVYRATSSKYQGDLAIKVMPRRYSLDPEFCELMNREESLTQRLAHPNIVRFYEFGVIEEYPYIVMEFVEGDTVHDCIPDSYLDPLTAARWVLQVCNGLSYAHLRGVVHLDIKPSNVMVQPDGTVKIIDFGLARGIEEYKYRGEKLWGSAGYTAPERRDRPKVLDFRSDIYSTGVMLCFGITGYLPEQLVGYTFASAGIPEELAQSLAQAVDPRMEKRLSSISSFGDTLARYIKATEAKLAKSKSPIRKLLSCFKA